jgi:hypothetical protein
MTRGQATAIVLASAHLLLVAGGAARLLPRLGDSAPVKALQWYGTMSGADAGYNFFAPRVGSQIRVVFTLTDREGRTWKDALEGDTNQEVRLRLGSLSSLFPMGFECEGEALRHDLCASWAATVLSRHPDAEEAEVRVEKYEVPPMAEYRAGSRPRWQPVHATVFRPASSNGEAGQP